MRILCILLVTFGAVIMTINLFLYYRFMSFMKRQVYDEKVFNAKIHPISFSMILFFLVGYIIMDITIFMVKGEEI